MTDVIVCTPQPMYLIIETTYPVRGVPQLLNVVGPELSQVYRRVAQICAEESFFYEGKPLDGAPSILDLLKEYLLPGTQLTTRQTGKRELMLVYAGFRNLLRAFTKLPGLPDSLTRERDLGTPPSPFIYGEDPIPTVKLYGNSSIEFTSFGGTDPPVAVAIYDAVAKKLSVPPAAERKAAIQKLLFPSY